MKNRNGKHKPARHINVLQKSKQDDIALAVALEDRFKRLCGDYLRIKGEEIHIPRSLDGEFFKWRTMMVRLKKNDMRNTEAEMQSVKTIAQWTLSIKAELVNQPVKTVEWR